MELMANMAESNEEMVKTTEKEIGYLLEQKYEFEREIRVANKANEELESTTKDLDEKMKVGAGSYMPCMDMEELEDYLDIGKKILDLKEAIDRGSVAGVGLRETNRQLQTRYTLLSGLAMEER